MPSRKQNDNNQDNRYQPSAAELKAESKFKTMSTNDDTILNHIQNAKPMHMTQKELMRFIQALNTLYVDEDK
jgi:TnpA family transposase